MSSLEQKQLTKDVLSAAEQGHRKMIQELISRQAVNVLDEEGSTPLLYAAANGREEIIRLLLDKECLLANKLETDPDEKYIDQQNSYKWTALMQAACYGHLNAVVSLIQRGAKVNVTNSWGATALVGASQGGYYGVVHKLLNVGAEVNPEGDSEFSKTLTPLMAATQCGHVEIVQELLRRGANVEAKLEGTMWTALMLAALNNQLPVMEILLKHGAQKDARDINDQTAADLASALGHLDVVFLLTGNRPKECTDVEFFDLVRSGDVDKVKTVIEKQKELANSKDKDGATPLMLAANRGNIKMCDVLLEGGAEVNTKDSKYGWTALMLATHQKKYEVVQFLGEKGADVNIRGKSGSTAFDIANMISDIRMIRLVANISVEQIQKKAPSAPPPLSIPALTGKLDAISEHVKPPSSTQNEDKTGEPEIEKKSEPSIDLTDLKHKLDKAYRTPTPSISVDNDEPVTSPSQSRFPTARIKSHPTSSVRRLATPTSLSSSAASEPPSLASSSSSSTGRSSVTTPIEGGSSAGRGHLGNPFNDQGLGNGPSSSSSNTKHKPTNLKLKGSLPKTKGAMPSPRGQLPTPRSSTARRTSTPSFLQPKMSPVIRTNSSSKTKPKETNTMSPLKFDRDFGSLPRRRADTAPVSPLKSASRSRKKISITKPTPGIDLKAALEQESLGHFYSVFRAQEIDYDSFLTLDDTHLEDLGIDSDSRELLLALIAKLNSNAPVFIFQ